MARHPSATEPLAGAASSTQSPDERRPDTGARVASSSKQPTQPTSASVAPASAKTTAKPGDTANARSSASHSSSRATSPHVSAKAPPNPTATNVNASSSAASLSAISNPSSQTPSNAPTPSSQTPSIISNTPSQTPSQTPTISNAPSLSASPRLSRETSPARPPALKLQHSTTGGPSHSGTSTPQSASMVGGSSAVRLARSRKGSGDLSPQRAATTTTSGPHLPEAPSAAAVQRALSAAGAPRLPSPIVADSQSTHDDPTSISHSGTRSNRNNGLPTVNSSRVRSPPRSTAGQVSRAIPSLSPDADPPTTPSIVVNNVTPRSVSSFEGSASAVDEDDHNLRSGVRSPTRLTSAPSTLEAVQESHLPETPAIGNGAKLQSGKRAGKRPTTITETNGEESNTSVPPSATSGPSQPNSAAAIASTSRSHQALDSNGRPLVTSEGPSRQHSITEKEKGSRAHESGSDSGNNREPSTNVDERRGARPPDSRRSSIVPTPLTASAASSRPPSTLNPRKSFTSLTTSKNKIASEGVARNMTVDTETVRSVPQNAVGVVSGDRGASGGSTLSGLGPGSTGLGAEGSDGNLRPRPSSETIRPKKDRKRTVRKAPSVHAGAASSKADIFEAQLKSAVEGANSSDSEETFVYESNPPEPPSTSRPLHRAHSRTPSAASMISQIERYRTTGDGHGSIVGKKSMKFTTSSSRQHDSSAYGGDAETGLSSNSTLVSGGRNGTHTGTVHHHHIGRHGRPAPTHATLLDSDGLFVQSPRSAGRAGANGASNGAGGSIKSRFFFSSAAKSPRSPHGPRSAKSTGGAPYELGEADDERTPLLPPARSPRTRHSRRPVSGWRSAAPTIDDNGYYYRGGSLRRAGGSGSSRSLNRWRRFGACALLTSLLALTVGLLVAALVLCSQPLQAVDLLAIRNVLPSDQEIIFDLNVAAINPNLVAIQVNELDILIHARSKYVGTSKFWREHGRDGTWSASSTDADLAVPARISPPETSPPETSPSEVDSHSQTSAGQAWQEEQSSSPSNLPQPPVVETPSHHFRLKPRHDREQRHTVDHGSDPIPVPDPDPDRDPSSDPHVMLLGQIFTFDAPLIFDPSPLARQASASLGEVRLARPGNRTEAGGSDRWETVIQHPFDLIVQGVIRYSVPLSNRVRTASIRGRVRVVPDDEADSIPLPDRGGSLIDD